jgi:hypothetical protein
MSTRDRVKLTAQERQQFAELEAALEASDPALAQVLKGEQVQAPAPCPATPEAAKGFQHRLRARAGAKFRPAKRHHGRAIASSPRAGAAARVALGVSRRAVVWPWTGLVLVLLGAALTATGAGLASLYWLSVPGAAMVGVGCGLSTVSLRRSKAKRAPCLAPPASPEAQSGAGALSA